MEQCGNLLGITTEQIIEAIKNILETEKHYERLRAMAPNEKQALIINVLITDQRQTYTEIANLYRSISCNPLTIPPINIPTFTNYLEGIKQAMQQELEENSNIIPLYSASTVQVIQRAFIAVLFKTYLHTAYLNYLLTINMCK